MTKKKVFVSFDYDNDMSVNRFKGRCSGGFLFYRNAGSFSKLRAKYPPCV